MKKIAKPLFCAFAISFCMLAFTSCQKEKDWTCKCYVGSDLASQTPITGQKKKDAKKLCDAKEDNGIDCKLD